MNTFREVFPHKHTFLAVVHVENLDQTVRNVFIAIRNGADGVFLINHSVSSHELLLVYRIVKYRFPNFWVGLNCLDLGTAAIKYIPLQTHGLWVDNAGINDTKVVSTKEAERFEEERRRSGWGGVYFGGVAFKYQTPVSDVGFVAQLAVPYVDIITTSGDGTEKAASIGKIRSMKEAIGSHPLAIASGITPENVHEYMPYADCFLVATGISDSHTELNPKRVLALAKALGK